MNILTLWVLTGIILLIAEMMTGTFVMVFIALGCFFAALSSLLFVNSLNLQIIVCAVISLGGAFLLRKPLQRKLLKSANHESDLGKEIVVDQEISPHQQARISYQGTTWAATNVGTEKIHQGNRATIVGVDGNILLLKKN
jgi:membrane protein implicated in regulation of membrane protease activity